MVSVRSELNQVWDVFRGAGIADDLTIIEHVAALLLDIENITPPPEFRLRKPPSTINVNNIRTLLHELIRNPNVANAATLLDRFALFRLPEMLPGQRYPTPRHIARFMQRIAGVQPQHSLADFACGSGGMLALRNRSDEAMSTTYGCDISPEWARLAWANCALHGIKPQIEIGDSLSLNTSLPATVDRVLMNPPFGAKISAGSGRSENLMIKLALDRLAADGRACVLSPAGLLFSGGADRDLRKRLVDKYKLHAIIGLPKDAFQPYSPIQTFVMLAQNTPPTDDQRTWFFCVELDGYKSGRSRDLTELPDNIENDLPIIEQLLTRPLPAWDDQNPQLGVSSMDGQNGYLISSLSDNKLVRVEHAKGGSLLLISVRSADNSQYSMFGISLAGDKFTIVPVTQPRDDFIREQYKIKKSDPVTTVTLLREEDEGDQVVITSDWRLLGVRVARTAIYAKQYDLRPDRYVRAEEQRQQSQAPALLLADIRRNQRKLLVHVDGLLGRLEMAPAAGGQLLPPVWTDNQLPIAPFGTLSDDQAIVWKHVQQQVIAVSAEADGGLTPTYFTAEEVARASNVATPTTLMTLDLLEHTGLIVKVMIQDGDERVPRYRLANERDRWIVVDPSATEESPTS